MASSPSPSTPPGSSNLFRRHELWSAPPTNEERLNQLERWIQKNDATIREAAKLVDERREKDERWLKKKGWHQTQWVGIMDTIAKWSHPDHGDFMFEFTQALKVQKSLKKKSK